MTLFNYKRRKSWKVSVGNVELGGDFPIRLQSMANVSTMDTLAAIEQAKRISEAGGQIVRFTAQGVKEARNLQKIKEGLIKDGYSFPLVADIHFNPAAAEEAALHVEKIRINPGNFVERTKKNNGDYSDEEYAAELKRIEERFIPLLNICREHHTAIRIGVNHGSLSERIMDRYGDTPEGMVESCMEFLRICKRESFPDVVVSIKSSNTVIMVQTVRLLVKRMEEEGLYYPLHLGVTEAGEGEDGRIKSAVGIGALLADGIGDTIRVSLSEEPEKEIPVAMKLVKYISRRENHPYIKGFPYPSYDPIFHQRRKSRSVENIGGDNLPVTVSVEESSNNFSETEVWPDYVYLKGKTPIDYKNLPSGVHIIVDEERWIEGIDSLYPMISLLRFESSVWNIPLLFVKTSWCDLTEERIAKLSEAKNVVLVLESNRRNPVGEGRAAIHRLMRYNCDVPVILYHRYFEKEKEDLQVKAGCDFGTLLLDGFTDGIMLSNYGNVISSTDINSCMFAILQAARVRMSKVEYISCPGCGRTLFNLQKTVAEVKEATKHLKNLRIGVMGCIVNGPGEMADSDYGYVGAGRGCVSLYKGKECILKNIPEEEAVERLVVLIKENGDWIEKSDE
ncbi:MAG: 4-hydroxy-3-methylbut-2-en-1-yl diphosphate synthase [Bacteroidales bacterium]|nr:4-hydroxy-3-methylbut-2-en-1-yl diphosphate synthase [Bacteroidales bacterium]